MIRRRKREKEIWTVELELLDNVSKDKLHWKSDFWVMDWVGIGSNSHQYFPKEWKLQNINFYLQFKNEKSVIISLSFHSSSSICTYGPRGTIYAHNGQFLLMDSILNVGSFQSFLSMSHIVQSHRIQMINNVISISNCCLLQHKKCWKPKRYHSLSMFSTKLCLRSPCSL